MTRKPNESAAGKQPIRCAIYTRKSTEEGLQQEFNSLDAKRASARPTRVIPWHKLFIHNNPGRNPFLL